MRGVLGQCGGNFAGGLIDIVLAENVPAITARLTDQISIRLWLSIWSNYYDLRRRLGVFFVGNDNFIAHFRFYLSAICAVGQ